MGYSTLAEVKALLRITVTDYDTEITTAIADADTRIDTRLMTYVNVPLASPPASITKASKYLSAALWLRLNPSAEAPQKRSEVFEEIGLTFLQEYIDEKYKEGKMRGGV